ncbi:hypothetical protein EWK35_25200, partial [Salmonella enterica subsp. enterica serovar Poano]|nr:hypothetical protein [Salmonella enterica subsp. enterica serovar Poano]
GVFPVIRRITTKSGDAVCVEIRALSGVVSQIGTELSHHLSKKSRLLIIRPSVHIKFTLQPAAHFSDSYQGRL